MADGDGPLGIKSLGQDFAQEFSKQIKQSGITPMPALGSQANSIDPAALEKSKQPQVHANINAALQTLKQVRAREQTNRQKVDENYAQTAIHNSFDTQLGTNDLQSMGVKADLTSLINKKRNSYAETKGNKSQE